MENIRNISWKLKKTLFNKYLKKQQKKREIAFNLLIVLFCLSIVQFETLDNDYTFVLHVKKENSSKKEFTKNYNFPPNYRWYFGIC